MKSFWTCLVVSVAVFAYFQTVPNPAEAAQLSIADFGLAYPLSNDWVRATEMLRKKVESDNSPQNFDVLLAAVYVPKSNLSGTNPFFSVYAYRQPAADCKKSLEAMIAHSQDKKDRPEGGVEEFSAAGRLYFRVNLARGVGGLHQCVICTAANDHLLVWNAGAHNEKGLDAIVATLDSITPLPQRATGSSAQSTRSAEGATEAARSEPDAARPRRVNVSSGVSAGLLVKKVAPIYPADARAAFIYGTVVLQVVISETGDVTDLELVNGPIELAGSAVAAVRQWKYKPYLLNGQPVKCLTQIQVNYQLQR
jgi:TonB family protein